MKDDLRAAIADRLPRLRRFAAALAGTVAAGDDLVQDACERALQRAGELRDATRLDGWLYSIIRNLWIDETRSRRVRRHEDLDAAASIIGEDGEAVGESRITLQAVRRCLGEMSADHRAVLVLVCVDGFSYKQASEVLDVPTGTVMSRLSRARQELRDRLEKPTRSDVAASPPATNIAKLRPL